VRLFLWCGPGTQTLDLLFPYQTPRAGKPAKRLLREFVHVMDLTSKKGVIFRRVDPLLLVRQTLHRLGGTQKRFCGALKEQIGEANVALHSAKCLR
jgi:hypothetical protein